MSSTINRRRGRTGGSGTVESPARRSKEILLCVEILMRADLARALRRDEREVTLAEVAKRVTPARLAAGEALLPTVEQVPDDKLDDEQRSLDVALEYLTYLRDSGYSLCDDPRVVAALERLAGDKQVGPPFARLYAQGKGFEAAYDVAERVVRRLPGV